MSPAVLREGPYRFYFVSHDLHEPPHVHVDRDAFSAKFWLNPVALAFNLGFPARELRKLETITSDHQNEPKQRAHSQPKVPPISMAGGLATGLASELKIDVIPYGRRFPAACSGESSIIGVME